MLTPAYGLTATERVLPRLALDFTTASLDPRVTVARALNTATRVNASGYVEAINANLPRFDFSPTALTCRGLLIEETRENLLPYSQAFNDAWWLRNQLSGVTADAAVSPDGTSNADKMVENTGTTSRTLQASVAVTVGIGATFTTSVFAKADGRRFLYINQYDSTSRNVYFDLQTGTVGTIAAGSTATITDFGNGWYRCTATRASGTATVTNFYGMCAANNTPSYAGDGASGVLLYGAQCEVGAFATSYIPTTTTSLTRNADVAQMTGTNFSDWYNASEGTMIAEGTALSSAGNRFFTLGSGLPSNYHIIAATVATTVAGGSTQAAFNNSVTANTIYRSAYSYKLNSFANAINGGAVSTDPLGSLPTGLDRAEFGSIFATSLFAGSGHLRKMLYYPFQLTSAELQAFSKQG